MNFIVQLKNIEKSYWEAGKQRTVFRDLNLDIQQGSSLAIVGRSGSGKSTLLNLISGIDTPEKGAVLVKGRDIVTLDETQRTLFRRQHVGFVFQSFNLIPSLTVYENLLMPLELSGLSRAGNVTAVIQSRLTDVGLADRADSFPEQLSGGEQQRIAIARAIIHQPDLILADEPTGNLDESNGQIVLDLLFDLVKQEGRTLLIVTHSREIAAMANATFQMTELNVAHNAGHDAA